MSAVYLASSASSYLYSHLFLVQMNAKSKTTTTTTTNTTTIIILLIATSWRREFMLEPTLPAESFIMTTNKPEYDDTEEELPGEASSSSNEKYHCVPLDYFKNLKLHKATAAW